MQYTKNHFVAEIASRFFQDRRLIVLTVLLAIASGVSSLAVLPRLEDPMLRSRAANIVTAFPGADAERVEALVTEKIEDKLLDVPEIKRLRSQSRAGSSFIAVELRDDVYDTSPAWSTIRGKLEESIASLPPGAMRPVFDELDIAAYAWIGALVWDRDDEISMGVVRRLARELKDTIYAVEGTKSIDLFGDPGEEIVVEIDGLRSASTGLSASAIAQQLGKTDVKSSSGILRSDESELVVELNNEFESLEDILTAELQTSVAGQSLRLQDVATVTRGTRDPVPAKAIIDGQDGVVVSVMLRPEYRIDTWTANARKAIQEFELRLPPGIRLKTVMEQSEYVRDRMSQLIRNLVVGVAAVALVTLIFMGWQSSLLVTATLPVAALMVVAGMRFLGIPIHQMSITGLIIAMGLLIDNAIIAADEIDISLKRGFSPSEAVGDMVRRLFAPLLASTVTTAFAFAPIALMEGPAGEFVGSIAVTVILAIFSSFLLAMSVLPATAALLQLSFKPHGERSRKLQFIHGGLTLPALTEWYMSFLNIMLRRPLIGIAIGITLPIIGFAASTQLKEQFFPPADRDQFYIEVELAPQAAIAQTEAIARAIDKSLASVDRIRHTTWFLGESAPPFYYNVIARRKNTPSYAQCMVTLDNNRSALELIRDLQLRLDAEFPSARILVRQLEQGPPFDAPVEIRVFGPNLDMLKDLGEQVRCVASNVPDVLHTRTALSDIRPAAQVSIDANQAQWLGLSESDIGSQIFANLEGIQAGTIVEETEAIPVRVKTSTVDRRSVEDLRDNAVFVSRATNGFSLPTAPVSSFATVDLRPQLSVITRYNGRRVNEVQNFITAGALPSTVLAELQHRLDTDPSLKVPAGYALEVGGEASERDAAVSRLLANVSILAVGIVAAIVLALSSFRLAALIGIVAVLSIGLGHGALWIFDYPFGFMAIIGTMGLIGIAINDSIVVIAALSHNERVVAGDLDATIDAVVEVTRHVLATTATTVVGFMPLIITGGGFWPPLAVVIGTGVAGATLISLTLVPCAFRLLHRPKTTLT